MANTLLSIQILPRTEGGQSVIPFVDEAIALIKQSKLPYNVAPLETTIEGDLSELLQLVERIHKKMIELGCPSTLSQIKISYNPTQGASMERNLEKYPNGQ